MLSITHFLTEKGVSHIDSLCSTIVNSINRVGNSMVKQNEKRVLNALRKLEPFVDFEMDTYNVDYRLIPYIDTFSHEPAITVELTFQGMVKFLSRKGLLSSAPVVGFVHENDEFSCDYINAKIDHTPAKERGQLKFSYVGFVSSNGENCISEMTGEELSECKSLASYKKYGNDFPYTNDEVFYAQNALRRALNDNISVFMEMSEEAELAVVELIRLNDQYFIDFDQMVNEYAAANNIKAKSRLISNQPSKTMKLLAKSGERPASQKVTKINVIDSMDKISKSFADSW